jgi:hypothetical protein
VTIVSYVLLRYTDFDYPFGIVWPLCCQFFFDMRMKNWQHDGQKIPKGYSESLYRRRADDTMAKRYQRGNQNLLPLWYLLAIVLSVLIRYRDSDYPFGILWPWCCQFVFDIHILITPLVSFGHCVVSSSSIYGFWLSELTTPWLKDIKGIIRISISKKNWQHDGQKIPKG